jgi:PncC family amidohydrolase
VTPSEADLRPLAERVGEVCRARGVTIATVESCTGGLVGHWITEVAGSSDYFRGGLLTYDDDVKTALADVPASVLAAHGAVSAQVAVAMASGGRQRLGVDLAVAITGVAGPGGGSEAKPVGLTYVAVADADGEVVRRFVWSGDRSANKLASAEAALRLIVERLEGSA